MAKARAALSAAAPVRVGTGHPSKAQAIAVLRAAEALSETETIQEPT
jgi:hypothetical protein